MTLIERIGADRKILKQSANIRPIGVIRVLSVYYQEDRVCEL